MTTRHAPTFALAAALAIAILPRSVRAQAPVLAPAGGQEPGPTTVSRSLGDRVTPYELISRDAVQRDVKLTPAQKGKLAGLNKARAAQEAEFRREIAEANQRNFQLGVPPVDPTEVGQEHRLQLAAESDATVAQILTAKQRARLSQIGLQVEGPMAFAREDVQEKLNLDAGQVASIHEILAPAQADLVQGAVIAAFHSPESKPRGNARPGGGADGVSAPDEAVKALKRASTEASDAALQKIVRSLRKKQVETYEKLKGDPYDPDKKPSEPAPASTTPAPNPNEAAKTPPPATKSTRKSRRSSPPGDGT